jgi:hypothetical protein
MYVRCSRSEFNTGRCSQCSPAKRYLEEDERGPANNHQEGDERVPTNKAMLISRCHTQVLGVPKPGREIITKCAGTKSHTYDDSWYRKECHTLLYNMSYVQNS